MMGPGTKTDYDWFIDTDLSSYAGEWIAILNKKIIAHQKDLKMLISIVEETYPGKKASFTKVSKSLSIL